MAKKTFDCVDFQHTAGEKVMRKLESMTPEERAAYYARRRQEFLEMQRQARAKRETAAAQQ